MTNATLEHVNITVTDTRSIAEFLCKVFDWHIRWQGPSLDGGHSIHVGSDNSYLAIYETGERPKERAASKYAERGSLNHVGVVVDDLIATEKKVIDAGFEPHDHQDYEPGLRFYFDGPDDIEFEVVSYQK